jgi:hypothetical protein
MSVGAFGIEKEGLEELLKEAACGKSQLPEFQRGWVWPDREYCITNSFNFPRLSCGNRHDVKNWRERQI